MSYKKSKHPLISLPRIPFTKNPALAKEEFWQQKEKSGAINAFRQLNNTWRRGGRKVTILPGGKLKPLFKNDSHPENAALGSNSALPNIPGCGATTYAGFKQILSGSLENLPPLCPTTVKIYLCSNYEDMMHERIQLLKQAVPELQSYCSQLGLQFQLVDLHWGSNVDEHNWSAGGFHRQLHQNEINDCQRLSIGPHFVCLLGDRYGVQQLPSVLTETEYQVMMEIAQEQSLSHSELLAKYYIKDENEMPTCYVFQKPEGLSELKLLHKVVFEALNLMISADKLTEERFQELTMSALEEDMRHGILDTKDPRSHCLCYHREFRNINSDLSQSMAQYVDTTVDETGVANLDVSLKSRVMNLAEMAEEHLGVGNFHNYYLGWSENLEDTAEFKNYLKKMTEDFVKDVKEMIAAGYNLVIKEISSKRSISSMVMQEALFHLQKCKSVIADYTRNNDVGLFSRLEAFLQDPLENNRPFIIWGRSGMGKTTTAGVIAQQLKNWFGDDCVVVLRFLGSTWQSASIHRTITNITLQICLAYGINCPTEFDSFNSLYQVLVTFRSVLDTVSKKFASSHPLFIVLDAIDQLHPFQESMKSLWAMRDFPPNIHMILTTTDRLGEKEILSALTNTITVPAAVMEVPTLEEDEIRSYTEKFMMKSRRTLSEHQMVMFRMAIGKNSQPLYITQLMLKALRFHSNQEVSSNIPTTVEGLFAMQIESLEREVGESIVQNFVAFLTASPVGVLECELLDLLTNNKEVMAEVYSLHHQPSDSILLFPQKLLIVMKHALQDFLCEHLLLGRVALAWNHREIYQAASNMYNIIYPGIAEVDIAEGATDFSLMIHEQFANMFLPENRTDLLSELPKQLVDKSGGWIVLNQPQMVHVENVQKLHRVLIHLSIMVPVEGLARIKQAVLFNFSWLYTKLQAAGLVAVMQDVIDVLLLAKGLAVQGVLEGEEEEGKDADVVWKEIDLLYHFLQLAMPSLWQSVDNLAVEVLGRLLPLQMRYSRLRNLIEGAQKHLMTCQGPCIMPLYGCLPSPGGELRHTFSSATHIIDYQEQSGLATTFSQQSGVRVWRLDSTQQIHKFSVNKEQAVSGVLPGHAAPFIVIGHYSHLNHMMETGIWSLDTGVAVINMTLPHRFEAIALSLDDQILFLATTSQDVSKPNGNTLKRYVLGIKVMTKEVVYTLPCADHHLDGVRRIIPVAGLEDGRNALITLGGFTSKDLICWDVDKTRMDYNLEFEYFMDIFNINDEKNLGIGCSVEEGILVVIDLKDGTIIQTVHQTTFQNMQDVYVSRSGDFVVVATARDGIVIHSIPQNAQVKTIARKLESDDQMAGKPSKVTMDETEHFVFIGYHTGAIDIYSIVTGELLTALISHSKTINSLRVLSNDCLLSASDDNEAKLWHYGAAISDHLSVHMMSGDAQFDSALEHKTKATNPTIQMDVSQTRMMCCLFLANNDETIVTGSFNGPIQLWETESPEQPSAEITEKCEHGLTDLYLTYKDKLLVGHCINPDLPDIRTLQVWNFDSGQPIPFDKDVTVLVFTSCTFPTGDRILTISPSTDDRQKGIIVAIYDLFEMKCLASLQCNIYSSMDSTNLRLLGFTSVPEANDMELESINENDVSLAEVPQATTNKLYAVLDYFPSDGLSFFFTFVIHGDGMKDISMDHHEPIHLDTISPDCNIVMPNNICISGTKDGSLVVWNVASQMIITNFCDASHDRFLRSRQTASNLHVGPVTCLTATKDGLYIISGGVDGKVKVWNLNSKTLVHTFSKHSDRIIHVHVSSGNLITSSSADNNIAVWDLQEKKYLCGFYVNDYITDVTITKDRMRLLGRVNKKHPSLLVLKLAGLEIAK